MPRVSSLFLLLLVSLVASNPLHLERALPPSAVRTLGMDARLHPAATNYLLFGVSTASAGRGAVELGIATAWVPLGTRRDSGIAAFLSSSSPGGKHDAMATPNPVVVIVLCSLLLFLAWQLTAYRESKVLSRHCTASAHNLSSGRLWTLATSAVSHADGMHLLVNLIFFVQASRGAAEVPRLRLGSSPATFWAFAVGAAVFSAAASIVINRMLLGRRYYETSGLSGVLYALWAVIACGVPHARFSVFGYTTTAWGMMGANLLLSIFQGRQRLDVGCHLGGTMFGVLFSTVCGAGLRVKLPPWADGVARPLVRQLEGLGRPRGWECRDGPFAQWFGVSAEPAARAGWWGLGWGQSGGGSGSSVVSGVSRRAWVLGQWALLFGMGVSAMAWAVEARATRADEVRRRAGYE
jgi:membrane associated rhomboid family serine protease